MYEKLAESLYNFEISWHTLVNYSKQTDIDTNEKKIIKDIVESEGHNVTDTVSNLENRIEIIHKTAEKLREIVDATDKKKDLLYEGYNEISKFLYETAGPAGDDILTKPTLGNNLLVAKENLIDDLIEDELTLHTQASINDARTMVGTPAQYQEKVFDHLTGILKDVKDKGEDPLANEEFMQFASLYGMGSLGRKSPYEARLATTLKLYEDEHIDHDLFIRLHKTLNSITNGMDKLQKHYLSKIKLNGIQEMQKNAEDLLKRLGH